MGTTFRELIRRRPSLRSLHKARLAEYVEDGVSYRSGPMELVGVGEAMAEAELMLARAREAGRPVIHIAHDAGPRSLYDVQAENGQIASQVAPLSDELTIIKNFSNSFAQTDLVAAVVKTVNDLPA